MILNTRIDERLIHGQIATMWTNSLQLNRIIVVDDEVVQSTMQKDILKVAKPSSIKLSILSAGGAATRILSGKYDEQRAMLLVKKPETLVQLVDLGVTIKDVNVGNMSTKQGSKLIAKSISVTDEDAKAFDYLATKGVTLYHQLTPRDERKDFMHLLEGSD